MVVAAPVSHAWHVVSPAAEYVPLGHEEGATAPVPAQKDPSGHFTHSTAAALLLNFPAGQLMHTDADVAPTTLEYLPASQVEQVVVPSE